VHIATVTHVLGHLLIFLSVILLVPLGLMVYGLPGDYMAFIHSSILSLAAGLLIRWRTGQVELQFSPKEGFAIVTFGWAILAFFGSLPYLLTDLGEQSFSWVDAYFETISGLSTTGASIVNDIEALPRPILFWRSLTHWIGGMGVVVLFLAILPALGAGGFQLFRAEVPGPTKDKLSPKIGNTAKKLWLIYLALSLACFFSLHFAGMGWFDALCHTFATIATGGFSTLNNSVAGFESWKIDLVITIFMFLSGCNFILLIHFIAGRWGTVFKNEELRFYTFSIGIAIIVISIFNSLSPSLQEMSGAKILMDSAFQVVCIITSTGFATADYDLWPLLCQFILLLLMVMGACAGSTGGGMKVFRVLVAFKVARREVAQLIHPRAVLPLKIDGQHISNSLTHVIIGFVSIFILLSGMFAFVVIALEGDRYNMLSLVSICVSCLSNIGPGLDSFGPTDNYAPLKDATKCILSFMMLLGRLELYSVLVMFHPSIWKS
jgi:trk system potassium uptake protein